MSTQSPKYSYGSTQVNLPSPLARQIKAWSRQWIPRSLLAEDGYESVPHITVKYGIKDTRPRAALKAALAPLGPIHATFGNVQTFTTNPDFDVVYLAIDSPELAAANKAVKDAVDCDDTHPVYQPHLTLAYVEKGKGNDLVGSEPFAGKEVVFESVLLSSRSGRKTAIALTGGKPVETDTRKGIGRLAIVWKGIDGEPDPKRMAADPDAGKWHEDKIKQLHRDHDEMFGGEAWKPKPAGKVGDYLKGDKVRKLYHHALETPVVLHPMNNNYATRAVYDSEKNEIGLNTNNYKSPPRS